jgi:RNA polymerase sigma factor (sigma-70 family)
VKDTIDLKIWQRFKDGDSQALTKIYNCYVKELYFYGKKICQDDALIKDSIQEIFVKLIDKRQHLVISENIHVYLFKSLRNQIVEELRSDNRKKSISSQITPDSTHVSSIEQSIVSTEEETRKLQLIDQAMNSLTDYQREAIYLRFSKMFEYEEISVMLGIDVASARTLVYRSLKKVKEHLSARATILFSMIVTGRL